MSPWVASNNWILVRSQNRSKIQAEYNEIDNINSPGIWCWHYQIRMHVLTATSFWHGHVFCNNIGTCAKVLCWLSLVHQHRESTIYDQIFCNNYCSCFLKSVYSSFIKVFFFSVISFAREYFILYMSLHAKFCLFVCFLCFFCEGGNIWFLLWS